jgi:hypothetical protein
MLVTPYCKRTRPGRGTNTKAAGFPPLSRLLSPLRARPHADPSGLGHATTFSLVGPGTPRSRNADTRLHRGCAANSKGCLNSGGCPIGRRGLCRTGESSPRGDLAIQVPATPAGKVRWYVKPIRILAGIRHRYYGSRWRHCCNGNILPCSLVWAGPDLAHEPRPRIDLLLGRALCVVYSELRQCLLAAWRGGSPPRSEAGTR